MAKSSKFSGQLYQLRSNNKISTGSYVAINGPYDSFGVVLKSEKEGKDWLNLIRGTKARLERPVAQF